MSNRNCAKKHRYHLNKTAWLVSGRNNNKIGCRIYLMGKCVIKFKISGNIFWIKSGKPLESFFPFFLSCSQNDKLEFSLVNSPKHSVQDIQSFLRFGKPSDETEHWNVFIHF